MVIAPLEQSDGCVCEVQMRIKEYKGRKDNNSPSGPNEAVCLIKAFSVVSPKSQKLCSQGIRKLTRPGWRMPFRAQKANIQSASSNVIVTEHTAFKVP